LTKPIIKTKLPEDRQINAGGAWPFVLDHVEPWAWRKEIFTPAEMDTIIRLGETVRLDKARTHSKVQSDKDRNSQVSFLFPGDLTNWIFARLTAAIVETNEKYFGFDLTGLEQGLQFTKYVAPSSHYDWHLDRGFNFPTRKLSMTLQLSEPDDYKGGALQLKFGKRDTTLERERGMAYFFPSYTLHRVKPVTEGTRYSLVAWVAGPPFK